MADAIEATSAPHGSSVWAYLAKNGAGNLALKASSALLAFLVGLLLARVLGAAGYGAYAFAMACIGLLAIPAVCGFDTLLVRHTATCQANAEWGEMRGMLCRADQIVFVTSFALAAATALLVRILHGWLDPHMASALWWALPLLPLTAFMRLKRSALVGLHDPMLGHLCEWLVGPLLFVALIAGAAFLTTLSWDPTRALHLNITATGAACVLAIFLLRARLPAEVKRSRPNFHTRRWVRAALPMVSITALTAINAQADLLFIGSLKGPEPAGLYAVAQKGCLLVSLVLGVGNSVWEPVIARLYSLSNLKELQRVITVSVRVIALVALPVALGLIVFGPWFLSLFGPEFPSAHLSLSILCLGQLVNVAMGPVGVILMMTGFERDVAKLVLVSAVVNVCLNALLVPPWGMTGAAVATTTSLVLLNIVLARRVRRRTGLRATALG